jgi:hypothetical protein
VKLLALFLSVLLLASSAGPAASSTGRDNIAELKKICEGLVDARDDWHSALMKLSGYADSTAFKTFHLVCDGSRCSGILALRDSSEIYLSFRQSQDYDSVGSGRIDTLVLRNRGKISFSVGDNGGRDSHEKI